jgi:hypothetical protein
MSAVVHLVEQEEKRTARVGLLAAKSVLLVSGEKGPPKSIKAVREGR